MSLYQTSDGGLVFAPVALSDTTQTTIVNGASKGGMVIDTIQLSNTTGSAINCSVHISDGTTDWQLEGGISVGANDQEIIAHPGAPMTDNYALKVTGDAGIQVLVTYVRDIYSRQGAAPTSRLGPSK